MIYVYVLSDGQNGTVRADTVEAAVEWIFNRHAGIEIRRVTWDPFRSLGDLLSGTDGEMRPKDVQYLSRMLGLYLGDGRTTPFDAIRFLRDLVAQARDKRLLLRITRIQQALAAAKSVSAALEEGGYPREFLPLVTVAQDSGRLPEVLKNVSDTLSTRLALRTEIRNALISPAMTMIGLFVMAVVMFLFVLPKMSEIFYQAKGQRPGGIMAAAVDVSVWTHAYPFSSAVLGILVSVAIPMVLLSPSIRQTMVTMGQQIPGLDEGVKLVRTVRFCLAMEGVLEMGQKPLDGIRQMAEHSRDNVDVRIYRGMEGDMENRHYSLSEAVSESAGFAEGFGEWLQAVEASGDLSSRIVHIRTTYDEILRQRLDTFRAAFGPATVIVMGVFVVLVVISLVGPMFDMVSQLLNSPG